MGRLLPKINQEVLFFTENGEFVSFQLLRRSGGCVSKSDDRCTASSQKGARLGKVRTSSNEKLSFDPKMKWKEIIDLKGKWEAENITFGILLQSSWAKLCLCVNWWIKFCIYIKCLVQFDWTLSLKCLKICWFNESERGSESEQLLVMKERMALHQIHFCCTKGLHSPPLFECRVQSNTNIRSLNFFPSFCTHRTFPIRTLALIVMSGTCLNQAKKAAPLLPRFNPE